MSIATNRKPETYANPTSKFVVGSPNAISQCLVQWVKADGVAVWSERFDPFDDSRSAVAIGRLLDFKGFQGDAKEREKTIRKKRVEIQNLVIGGVDDPREMESYTLAEMANLDFLLDYIVDGFMVADQPMMIAGKDKTLKSTIALDLAIATATGGSFLNDFPVLKKQNVYFISAESGMATIKDKARVNLATRDLELADVPELVVSPEIISLTSLPDMGRLKRDLKKHNARVLIVDPTYLALPSDAMSNVFAQGENLRGFAAFCQDLRVTLILVHHAKKTITHFDPLERGDMAGAGFGEFVRQWLLINKREPIDMGTGKFKLWLTYGGSAGHSGGFGLDIDEGIYSSHFDWRQWEIQTHKMSDCRKELAEKSKALQTQRKADKENAEIESLSPKLIKLLKTPQTLTDIRTRFGRTKALAAVLDGLTEEKRIERTEITKGNNRTFDGYKLAD